MYSSINRAAKLTLLLLLNIHYLIITCNNVRCHLQPQPQSQPQPQPLPPNHTAQSNDANQRGSSLSLSSSLSSSSSSSLSKDLRLAHSLLAVAASPAITTTTTTPVTQTQEAPDFTEPIGNHTIALGRDAQLSCKIRNLGNFRTAWLRVEDKGILTIHNNIITRNYRIGLTNNDDGKNFILTIKNVQPSDRGGYMCQINSVPMKYAIGYLDVLTPPVFDDQPTMTNTSTTGAEQAAGQAAQQTTSVVTIAEGGNATLSCRATGHPSPVISWRREDNEPILLNGAASIEGALTKSEGSSITLSSVNRLSSGAYLCIASNNVQPSASKRQVLDVQFSPVVRLPQTELGAQISQQLVRLTCHVELNPLGSYHWVKLNKNEQQQQQQQQDGQSNNRQQLAGSNASELDDLALIEHDELINSDKFEIVIKQVNSDKVQMTLAIRQIERQDFAWYKCIGRNSLGTQSNSIRLYESSSFSLNNMFRGSSSDGGGNQRAGTLGENNNNQHLNDQQHQEIGSGNGNGNGASNGGRTTTPAKPVLSRTHTRSSWVRSSSQAGGRQDQANNALLDSPPGSSATSPLSGHCHYHYVVPLMLLLLLSFNSCYLMLAQIAQIVVFVSPAA